MALAFDVGGTKLAAALVDQEGHLHSRCEAPTPGPGALPASGAADAPQPGHAQAIAATLIDVGHRALAMAEHPRRGTVVGIGVGSAGPMQWAQGLVSPLNIPAWRSFPLSQCLERAFALPVWLHNDAVAIVAGEHWRGAAKAASNALAITVSTGVGGGLVLDGRIHHGGSGNAGHIGHLLVEPDGPPCACGARGCLEAVASGPRSVRWALNEGWHPQGGARPDGVALAAAARAGEGPAVRAVARAGRAVGVAVASATALLDLEVVAIVGGFARSGRSFWDPLHEAFLEHACLPFAVTCRVVPGLLGADAGLVGAAAFVLQSQRYGWTLEGGPRPAPA